MKSILSDAVHVLFNSLKAGIEFVIKIVANAGENFFRWFDHLNN
jgi:hypothetical protein